MSLPHNLINACTALRNGDPHWNWNVHDCRSEADCWATALGQVVAAFGPCEAGNTTHRRLVWLAFFAARRVLPCWQIGCDTDKPQRAVQAVHDWLTKTRPVLDWQELSDPALPSIGGEPILDCRECGLSGAAGAAASAIRLLVTGKPLEAAYALHEADYSASEWPLGQKDDFRRWLLEIAIPAAFAQRAMTEAEMDAYR